MSDGAQEQAVLVEERALQAAMLAGDVAELDRLLHPQLLAVGPDGQLITRREISNRTGPASSRSRSFRRRR
jgi:hypothetical protein